MGTITIDIEELEDIKNRFEQLAERRAEHNEKLEEMLDKLSNVKSNGFIEEIVEKLEDHIDDVKVNQFDNVEFSVDFLKSLIDNFRELDEAN